MSQDGKITIGLWKRTSNSSGVTYYAGKLKEDLHLPAGTYLNVFNNTRKKTDAHPDLNVIINPPSAQQRSEQGKPVEDDIPF